LSISLSSYFINNSIYQYFHIWLIENVKTKRQREASSTQFSGQSTRDLKSLKSFFMIPLWDEDSRDIAQCLGHQMQIIELTRNQST
jgi:hypothetical protein